jgi:hypothetical protein
MVVAQIDHGLDTPPLQLAKSTGGWLAAAIDTAVHLVEISNTRRRNRRCPTRRTLCRCEGMDEKQQTECRSKHRRL